jgi:molybdopterin-binding protein
MIGVLIRPEDIILSLDLPKTSARNTIRTRVTSIVNSHLKTGRGIIDVYLEIDNLHLISRITNESRICLGIREDNYIYAMFKAVSPHIIREEKCKIDKNNPL